MYKIREETGPEIIDMLRWAMSNDSDTDSDTDSEDLSVCSSSGSEVSSVPPRKTIHDIFDGVNDGLKISRYYNCQLVAVSVAEYFISGVLNKPQAPWFPGELDSHVGAFSKKPILIENASIAVIEMILSDSGKGSHAIISAEYSPVHEEGRYLFGLREKDWGHSFNIYYQGDGVFATIDAYSSRYLELSKNYQEYIKMYQKSRMDCYIWKGDEK